MIGFVILVPVWRLILHSLLFVPLILSFQKSWCYSFINILEKYWPKSEWANFLHPISNYFALVNLNNINSFTP